MDGASRVTSVEVIEADNDDDAIRKARSLDPCIGREVWQGDRRVAQVPADDPGLGAALFQSLFATISTNVVPAPVIFFRRHVDPYVITREIFRASACFAFRRH